MYLFTIYPLDLESRFVLTKNTTRDVYADAK